MAIMHLLAIVSLTVTAALHVAAPGGPSMKEWKAAKEDVAAEAEAVKAKEAKMSAVNKVISLLEGLKSKVLSEGEAEAQTYNKFACFCKDTTADKTAAIQRGTDEKANLASLIDEYSGERDKLDQLIQSLLTEIAAAEKTMKVAKANRAETLATYETNDADLRAAISALEGAISTLKSSKSPSFAQLQAVGNTVKTATLLADALGINKAGVTSLLSLSASPEVAMEDYKFHSDSIIETLEKLLDDFKKEKAEVDADEVSSVKQHDALIQEQTDLVKLKTKHLEDSKKAKATKQEEIAMTSQERSTVAATLLDDQEYLRELSEMCSDKATTYDQRTQVRQDELSALTAAIGVVTSAVSEKTSAATMRLVQQSASVNLAESTAMNPKAMEEIEAEAEAADNSPLGFLQRVSRRKPAAFSAAAKTSSVDDGRQRIASLFKSKGRQLKSTLLTALASQIAEDPFAKVKTLIQELIERLLQEASNDANQNDWCNKAISDAEQKRNYSSEAVEKHNSAMALLEASRDKLQEDLGELGAEIADLKLKRKEAEEMRGNESAENEATVLEAREGVDAIASATDIISKFYKTAAKETVEFSLAQRGPADDAPDAGFKIGEAYTGGQGEAGGILGMMEVIKSDFERTISETEKAEMEAEQDHLKFMTETGKSLKEKEVAEAEKNKQKLDVSEKLENEDEALKDQMDILTTSIKELLELKPVCIDTGMSYEDRVSRREEEIEALKKGLCILEKYAEYGPDDVADAC